jgi:hypothetical protein
LRRKGFPKYDLRPVPVLLKNNDTHGASNGQRRSTASTTGVRAISVPWT